jgi:ACS family hexuronate transporter-like MFS transporter
VAWLTIQFGWRSAFVTTGLMGFAWLALWLVLYQPPHRNRWLRPDEYEKMRDQVQRPEETAPATASSLSWKRVISMRGCYTLILTRFFTDPVIYFVIFWLPEYLRKERAFNLAMVGTYASIPFVFGGIAYVTGGWLSGRLMRAGWSLPRARKFVMALGAAMLPAAIFAPLVPTPELAIAAMCFVTFGHSLWVANLQTLPTDLFRGPEVGTATGFSGMGGAVGGILANLGTGYVVTHFSYTPIFLLAGLMHPLSAVLTYRLLPEKYFRSEARA